MQFLALIYGDEAAWEALGDRERDEVYARYRAFADEARAGDKLVDGGELGAVELRPVYVDEEAPASAATEEVGA